MCDEDMPDFTTIKCGPSKRKRLSGSAEEEESKKHSKQNHSEIEKRRRDKMNTYINELATMIPACMNMSRKMDKLTVLRLALQHLRTIKGRIPNFPECARKPPVMRDEEVKKLVLKCMTDKSFLFVVDTARGKILYASESVRKALVYQNTDLVGQSLFDILHPKDIPKVKEQLTSLDGASREPLLDPKTLLPLHWSDTSSGSDNNYYCSPGSRRSFLCRMKVNNAQCQDQDGLKDDHTKKKTHGNGDKKYVVIQCTGYIKSWCCNTMDYSFGDDDSMAKIDDELDMLTRRPKNTSSISCLVALARPPSPLETAVKDSINRKQLMVENVEFMARHAIDGKFTFVDHRITLIIGYLPQEIIGSSIYEYIKAEDLALLSQNHRKALMQNEQVSLGLIQFRCKDGKYIHLKGTWKRFRNPWTNDIDFVVSKYMQCVPIGPHNLDLMAEDALLEGRGIHFLNSTSIASAMQSMHSAMPSTSHNAMMKDVPPIDPTCTDVRKIGRQIASEVMKTCNVVSDTCLSNFTSAPHTSYISLRPNNPTTEPQTNSNMDSMDMMDSFDSRVANTATATDYQDGGDPGFQMIEECSMSNFIADTEPSMMNRMPTDDMCNVYDQPSTSFCDIFGPDEHEKNDGEEAAMAVIMNFLEADAGLGGPVDLNSLPWTLS